MLRELHPNSNSEVLAWYATVTESDRRISVMTFFEKRRGWERRKKDDPELANARLAELDALESAYRDRMVSIDGAVVAEWTRLLGVKDKNQRDKAFDATTVAHGFLLVTRNVDDMRGRNIQVLNPFKAQPAIEIVQPNLFQVDERWSCAQPTGSSETRHRQCPAENRRRLGGWAPFERNLQKGRDGSSIS